MSSVSTQEINAEFLKSKLGLTGIFILSGLILVSIITISVIPASTFQEWNNPEKWILYPKTSVPSWVNFLSTDKIPEHKILEPKIFQSQDNGIFLTSQQFGVFFDPYGLGAALALFIAFPLLLRRRMMSRMR